MKNIFELKMNYQTNLPITKSAYQQMIRENLPVIKKRIMERAFRIGLYRQSDLAAAVNIPREYLCSILNGKRNFPPELFENIADTLKCDIDYLLGHDETVNKQRKTQDDILKEYLCSFGLEYDSENNIYLLDSYHNRYTIDSSQFEHLKSHIHNIVSELLKYTFENNYDLLNSLSESEIKNLRTVISNW